MEYCYNDYITETQPDGTTVTIRYDIDSDQNFYIFEKSISIHRDDYSSYESYKWDEEHGMMTGREKHHSYTFNFYGDLRNEVDVYTFDDEFRLLEIHRIMDVSDGEYEDNWRLEYDADGDLILSDFTTPYGNKNMYTYHYGYISVIDNNVVELHVGEEGATVYNLQGVPVLKSASIESIRSLDKGIYIINGKKVAVN